MCHLVRTLWEKNEGRGEKGDGTARTDEARRGMTDRVERYRGIVTLIAEALAKIKSIDP